MEQLEATVHPHKYPSHLIIAQTPSLQRSGVEGGILRWWCTLLPAVLAQPRHAQNGAWVMSNFGVEVSTMPSEARQWVVAYVVSRLGFAGRLFGCGCIMYNNLGNESMQCDITARYCSCSLPGSESGRKQRSAGIVSLHCPRIRERRGWAMYARMDPILLEKGFYPTDQSHYDLNRGGS
jgi:hypothetical protein